MGTNNKGRKIEKLFSDSGPVDIDRLVDLLKPFLRIHRESHEIFLTDKGNEASVVLKIIFYALGKKLLKLEGLMDNEETSAREVSVALGLKKGTVDPTFKALRDKGILLGSGSKYIVPNYKLGDVYKSMQGGGENGK